MTSKTEGMPGKYYNSPVNAATSGVGTSKTFRARSLPCFGRGDVGFVLDIEVVQAYFARKTIMVVFPPHATFRGMGE